MDDEVFQLLDELDSGAAPHASYATLTRPQFKRPTKPIPPRDRYRTNRYDDPKYDMIDDNDQYDGEGQFDAFDQSILRQPYPDRQQQAVEGRARLSFAPASSMLFSNTASSQPQPSFRSRKRRMGDDDSRQSYVQQSSRADLGKFQYSATQPQASSSDTQLGASSSPAFKASQRRAENDQAASTQRSALSIQYKEDQHDMALQKRQQATRPIQKKEPQRPSPNMIGISHALPMIQGIYLVPTSVLPDRFRTVFPFPVFNAVQSKCFDKVYKSDDNFVLASPTASGKTAILELAVCRAVATNSTSQYKIVYQAPTKALCSERHRDWQKKFNQIGLNCTELTGDSDSADLRNVQSANIIVTTPEKWDSITRKWRDHEKLMMLIKLFLIDEVHILKEDRGATLEVIVSRMKSIGTDVRFVALSATVPNLHDVASWLGKNATEPYEPSASENFGDDFRPVKLKKHVCGYPYSNGNDFVFEKILDAKLPEVITKYSERKPIMIFCSTRNSTMSTAKMLANWWISRSSGDRLWYPPSEPIPFHDRTLRDCVTSGVAFHHAGMDLEDRSHVEKGFLDGKIGVICCTSTLAVGVNLPCHLVIIKNTVTFTSTGMQEYADLEMMQMMGRAGRPQFDDSAVAVIMTRQAKVRRYEMMVTGQEALESKLHLNLIDHMNAEIGLGTIRDLLSARQWIASTFLYIRLKQNPMYYKLEGARNRQDVEEQLDDICVRDITLLRNNNLVTGEACFRCTEYGHAMTRYYVQFDTMRIFLGIQAKAQVSEILSAIAQATEFATIRFRSGEKSFYRLLNKSPSIRFPIPVNLDLPAHKVSLIIQSVLGAADISWEGEAYKVKPQYNVDVATVFRYISRLIRCIIDCQICVEDSVSISNALLLERSLGARTWDDSPLQMKQVEGIGVVAVRKLVNAGIRSIEDLEMTEAHRIDVLLGKNPPFGLKILEKLKSFPKLRVSLHTQSTALTKTEDGIKVQVKADIGFINEKPPHSFGPKLVYVCLLVETSDGRKIHFARISGPKLGKGQSLIFPALLTSPAQSINCYIMCDSIAGTMRGATVKPKIAPSMFPTPKALHPETLRQPERPTSNISRRRKETSEVERKYSSGSDEFGDDGIDDDELMKVPFGDVDFDHIGNYANPADTITTKSTVRNNSTKIKPRTMPMDNGTDEDDNEPKQLPNGKWACNHKCKNKTSCKHMCCRDGLDKPPKKFTVKSVASNEKSPQSSSKGGQSKNKTQTKLQLTASKRKPPVLIEELDLTQQEKKRKADYAIMGPRDCRDLNQLHMKVQSKELPSSISSIMHKKPAYCYAQGGRHSLSFMDNGSPTDRPQSTSDYGDFKCDELSSHFDLPSSSNEGDKSAIQQGLMDVDDTLSYPIEDITPDRRSDTFGEDDSVLVDAMIGLADSEELQAADEDINANIQPIEESLHLDYDTRLDDDSPDDPYVAGTGNEQSNSILEWMTSEPENLPSFTPEKGCSLFSIDTASPQLEPIHNDFKSAKSMLRGPEIDELKKSSDLAYPPLKSHCKSIEEKKEMGPMCGVDCIDMVGAQEKENSEEKEENKTVSDAFKDLEPWLFKEFGDIVELVE